MSSIEYLVWKGYGSDLNFLLHTVSRHQYGMTLQF